MDKIIEFEIPGEPMAKARPRATVIGGHARVYTPQKTANYEGKVALAFKTKYPDQEPFNGAVIVNVKCYFPYSKVDFWPINRKHHGELREESKNKLHIKKPDCDNLAKSVLDGLNGIAFSDDSQIVYLTVAKFYSLRPRTEICVEELGNEE